MLHVEKGRMIKHNVNNRVRIANKRCRCLIEIGDISFGVIKTKNQKACQSLYCLSREFILIRRLGI